MNVIVLGSPGVGKGTYTSGIKNKYGLAHISTGDLFRENMKKGTELGKKAQEYINAGKLVPDEITVGMLKQRITEDDCKTGFVLDGFPRTVAQAEELESIAKIDTVLYFTAAEDVIIGRISGRRICRDCSSIYHIKNKPTKVSNVCDKCGGEVYQRADEKPEVVEERLRQFNAQTKPVVDYYIKKGILSEIDANLDLNDPNFHVIEDCQEILDRLK